MCSTHSWRIKKHGAAGGSQFIYGIRQEYIDAFTDPHVKECWLWPFSFNGNGYGAKIGGKYPHQIICERFRGCAPSDKHEVAHSCGNRMCINPAHLRWATHKEIHGTLRVAVLKKDQIVKIRSMANRFSGVELARMFNTSPQNINDIIKRKTWKWVDFPADEDASTTVSEETSVDPTWGGR